MKSRIVELASGRLRPSTQGRLPVLLLAAFGLVAVAESSYGQCVLDPSCDDGLFCTNDLLCNDGSCTHTPKSCSDGLFCNGSEVCNEDRDVCEFACVGGTICDSGFCVCNDGSGCPDGNVGQECSIFVQPPSCPKGTVCNETLNQCTECASSSDCTTSPELRCKTSTGECVECLSDSHCNDSSFCNGQETCNQSTGFCEDGDPVSCDFGEFCSDLLARCVQCENNADCDDGLYCNGQETCVNDVCEAGTPVDCAAMDPAKPHCKESSDTCVRCLTNTHCDDALFCTSDACVFDECVNTPDPAQFCDDGLYCNGAEKCNASLTGCDPGTPPSCNQTCFGGVTPGAACSSDAECGQACTAGENAGMSCTVDGDCGKACAGGSNNGAPCVEDSECSSKNCTARGLCSPGLCLGGCSESLDQCVQCASDVPGSTSCDNGVFCDGAETCNASHQCVAGERELCESFNTSCTKGLCNEAADACGSTNRADGTICDDDDHCTRIDECQSGSCVENLPEPGDPYRCVDLDLIPLTAGPIAVGSTVEVKLEATAVNCNVSSPNCPDSQHHPITGLSAILDWDPTRLELKATAQGDLNPDNPCNQPNNPCFQCPPNTYNWAQSNFPFDCDGDALNEPCSQQSPTPDNDGDAFYLAISQLQCDPPDEPSFPIPACVPPDGLHVTTFKFRVLEGAIGSTASVSLATCAGGRSTTQVISRVSPPDGGSSQDVTKSLGDPVTFNVVSCQIDDDCDDGDLCTENACLNGTCSTIFMDCTNADPCTVDSCDPATGLCVHDPVQCAAGERCYQGECFGTCVTDADCADGIACTVDACEPVPGDDVCVHTSDNEACDTGFFCAAQRCDVEVGCVFDHECFSTDGNPCPDNGSCDEGADTCGGCVAPSAVAVGCRYVEITPGDQGTTEVALLVEGDCTDAEVSCFSKYVQSLCAAGLNDGEVCSSDADCPKSCASGPLVGEPCSSDLDCNAGGGACQGECRTSVGDTPVFLTAAEWGTITVTAEAVRPSTTYRVLADCDFAGGRVLSAAADVTTWKWGDVDGNSTVTVVDIGKVVEVVKGVVSTATFEGANVAPCVIDDTANVIDIGTVVDAVKGLPNPCAPVCP